MATYGIDFNALTRGRRLAEQDNIAAAKERRIADAYEFQREEALRQRDEQGWNRQAQAYTAPILANWHNAADAGMSPADFFINQRESVLADQGFQGLSPEVQQRVLQSLGQSVAIQLQDAQRSGNLTDAARLARAYGINPDTVASPVDLARQSGDIEQQIAAANLMYGSNLVLNDDGTVDIAGVKVPAVQALAEIMRGRSATAAFPAAIQQLNYQQQLALQQARDAQMYAAAGFVQNQQGQWIPPAPTGGTPPAGSIPGAPGAPGATPEASLVDSYLNNPTVPQTGATAFPALNNPALAPYLVPSTGSTPQLTPEQLEQLMRLFGN